MCVFLGKDSITFIRFQKDLCSLEEWEIPGSKEKASETHSNCPPIPMGLRPWQVKVEGPTQEAQPLCRPQNHLNWNLGLRGVKSAVFQGSAMLKQMVLGLTPSPPLGSWICWFFTLSRALSHHLGLSCNLLAPPPLHTSPSDTQVTSSMNHNPGVREGWLTPSQVTLLSHTLSARRAPGHGTERVTPLSAWTSVEHPQNGSLRQSGSYVGVQMGCDQQQLWAVLNLVCPSNRLADNHLLSPQEASLCYPSGVRTREMWIKIPPGPFASSVQITS